MLQMTAETNIVMIIAMMVNMTLNKIGKYIDNQYATTMNNDSVSKVF